MKIKFSMFDYVFSKKIVRGLVNGKPSLLSKAKLDEVVKQSQVDKFMKEFINDFEIQFKRNLEMDKFGGAPMYTKETMDDLTKELGLPKKKEEDQVPETFIKELEKILQVKDKWWEINQSHSVIGCSLESCIEENEEASKIAKAVEEAELAGVSVNKNAIKELVREFFRCASCPHAIKEIAKSHSSMNFALDVNEGVSFDSLADFDSQGKKFIPNMTIHNDELSLFRQSGIGERAELLWIVEEDGSAIVNSPSGLISMNPEEFKAHKDALERGEYNILMGELLDDVEDDYSELAGEVKVYTINKEEI